MADGQQPANARKNYASQSNIDPPYPLTEGCKVSQGNGQSIRFGSDYNAINCI
jgi:hypothetical protein